MIKELEKKEIKQIPKHIMNVVNKHFENYNSDLYIVIYFEKKNNNLIINRLNVSSFINTDKKEILKKYFLDSYEVKKDGIYDCKEKVCIINSDAIISSNLTRYPNPSYANAIDYIDSKTAYLVSEELNEDVSALNDMIGNIRLYSLPFIYSLFYYKENKALRRKELIQFAYAPCFVKNSDKNIHEPIKLKLNKKDVKFIKKYNLDISDVITLKKYKVYDIGWISNLRIIDMEFKRYIFDKYNIDDINCKIEYINKIKDVFIDPFLNNIDFNEVKEIFDKNAITIKNNDNLLEYLKVKFNEERLENFMKYAIS